MWLTTMKDEEFFIKDWEMTKDRIKHFDDVVIRLRIQGLPIATAIQAAGWISFPYTKNIIVPFFNCTTAALILLFGSLYLIPIMILDMFHLHLMLKAVGYAKFIENDKFGGKIQITNKLTSRGLTLLHSVVAASVYLLILAFGLISAGLVWNV